MAVVQAALQTHYDECFSLLDDCLQDVELAGGEASAFEVARLSPCAAGATPPRQQESQLPASQRGLQKAQHDECLRLIDDCLEAGKNGVATASSSPVVPPPATKAAASPGGPCEVQHHECIGLIDECLALGERTTSARSVAATTAAAPQSNSGHAAAQCSPSEARNDETSRSPEAGVALPATSGSPVTAPPSSPPRALNGHRVGQGTRQAPLSAAGRPPPPSSCGSAAAPSPETQHDACVRLLDECLAIGEAAGQVPGVGLSGSGHVGPETPSPQRPVQAAQVPVARTTASAAVQGVAGDSQEGTPQQGPNFDVKSPSAAARVVQHALPHGQTAAPRSPTVPEPQVQQTAQVTQQASEDVQASIGPPRQPSPQPRPQSTVLQQPQSPKPQVQQTAQVPQQVSEHVQASVGPPRQPSPQPRPQSTVLQQPQPPKPQVQQTAQVPQQASEHVQASVGPPRQPSPHPRPQSTVLQQPQSPKPQVQQASQVPQQVPEHMQASVGPPRQPGPQPRPQPTVLQQLQPQAKPQQADQDRPTHRQSQGAVDTQAVRSPTPPAKRQKTTPMPEEPASTAPADGPALAQTGRRKSLSELKDWLADLNKQATALVKLQEIREKQTNNASSNAANQAVAKEGGHVEDDEAMDNEEEGEEQDMEEAEEEEEGAQVKTEVLRHARADPAAPFRKVVYLMRGPPGCGKSTAARRLLAHHLGLQGVQLDLGPESAFAPLCRAFIFSTDDYFTEVGENGEAEYRFNPRKLRDYHPKNQARCEVAMELGLTPLFVDNTNIALWEMREYVKSAERFGYGVQVVDPRELSDGALDPEVLASRVGEGAEGRAPGKVIPRAALERMVRNFEACEAEDPEAFEAIRQAKPPWEKNGMEAPSGTIRKTGAEAPGESTIRQAKTPCEKRPLYAGLDTEARALAAVGAVDLGPFFWGDQDAGSAHADRNLLDARYKEGNAWQLPDRLHVTVRFFGQGFGSSDVEECKALVDTWHEVEIRNIVFVRGGGILCAECALTGPRARELEAIAGDGWRPHITLLTAPPWQAKDSTAILEAWSAASASAASALATCLVRGKASTAEEVIVLDDDEHLSDSDGDAASPMEEDAAEFDDASLKASLQNALGRLAPARPPQLVADDASLKASLQNALGSLAPARPPQAVAETPAPAQTPLSSPGALPTEVVRDVAVCGQRVDLCAIRLSPPRSLGPCKFQLFFGPARPRP